MFPKLWGVVFRTEQEDASGSPAKFRSGASHLEKSYPHRELQRVQNHPHCPVQVYSCSGLPDQFKPVIPWSSVILLVVRIVHLCCQSCNYGGSAAILRHIWPHFLLYGQRILPVSPVLTEHFGFHGHNGILASH